MVLTPEVVPPPGSPEGRIRRWLREFVVGLDLCPFARPLLSARNLRIVICDATDEVGLRRAFLRELDLLQGSDESDIATTLLAFTDALLDFDDYLHFLAGAEELVVESGLEGLFQLASFHPNYQFQGEDEDAAGHYSNRAPYPLIHLLRENMLTRVLADYPAPEQIPARNMKV